MPMNDRLGIECLILCGFLGSGKTTLLGRFLAGRDLHDTAVIVNEAGEVGIDAAVLQTQAPDDPVLMLDNGCICCSLRSSLVDTVLRLIHAPRPMGAPPLRRIVIETSGISRPGAVLATLRDRDLIELNLDIRVLCTFDASRPDEAPEHQMDEALAQWAAAQRIVLTKLDLIDAAGIERARLRVARINPLAECVVEPDIDRRVRGAFGPLSFDAAASGGASPARSLESGPESQAVAHPRIRVFRGGPASTLDWAGFAAWVDDLTGLLGERLLRFKAIVMLGDMGAPVLLQSVGTQFSAPQPAGPARLPDGQPSSVIVIARDCELDWIHAQLADAPVRLSPWQAPSDRTIRLPIHSDYTQPEEEAP
jgi:G3E family GTPase